jgi:hypothetical protein
VVHAGLRRRLPAFKRRGLLGRGLAVRCRRGYLGRGGRQSLTQHAPLMCDGMAARSRRVRARSRAPSPLPAIGSGTHPQECPNPRHIGAYQGIYRKNASLLRALEVAANMGISSGMQTIVSGNRTHEVVCLTAQGSVRKVGNATPRLVKPSRYCFRLSKAWVAEKPAGSFKRSRLRSRQAIEARPESCCNRAAPRCRIRLSRDS